MFILTQIIGSGDLVGSEIIGMTRVKVKIYVERKKSVYYHVIATTAEQGQYTT